MIRNIFITVIIITALWLAFRFSFFPTYSYSYKIIATVEDDGKIRSGSGVIQIKYSTSGPDMFFRTGFDSARFYGFMDGCAVSIDLGARGQFFLLNIPPLLPSASGHLKYSQAVDLVYLPLIAFGFPYEAAYRSQAEDNLRHLISRHDRIEIPFNKLPMIVRLSGKADDSLVEEADPQDLASTFGGGVKLLSVVLEKTGDALTSPPGYWPKWVLDKKINGIEVKNSVSFLGNRVYTNAFFGTD